MSSTREIPEFSIAEFHGKHTKYLWVIPVLNEAERIQNQLARMKPQIALCDVIVVDGGSTDGSVDLEAMKKTGIRALLVKKGKGKLSAQLRIGFAYALREGYAGVVLMDGNNKDNPAAVTKFIEALEQDYDYVQGSRFLPGGKQEHTPLARYLGIRLLHAPLISIASGIWYTDTTNGFKALSRKFLEHPKLQPFRDVFDTYELHSYIEVRAGDLKMKTKEIPVERVYPATGAPPTKIKKISGNFLMLKILFKACLRQYDPR